MSSFGCKSPLPHATLTKDKWYENAEEMHNYLDVLKMMLKNTSTLLMKKSTTESQKASCN